MRNIVYNNTGLLSCNFDKENFFWLKLLSFKLSVALLHSELYTTILSLAWVGVALHFYLVLVSHSGHSVDGAKFGKSSISEYRHQTHVKKPNKQNRNCVYIYKVCTFLVISVYFEFRAML